MNGLRQIVNANHNLAAQEGGYAAQACITVAKMTPNERAITRVTGRVPVIHLDAGRRAGFDEFALAAAIRAQLDLMSEE